MRHALASAAVAAALFAGREAHGQIPVIDNSSLVQEVKSYLQELKSYATQLQQLEEAAQQVQWAASTYESFVHSPNLGTATALLGQVGIQNPLPFSPYTVQGLIDGRSGLTGALGSLGALSNSSLATNHVYTPADGSWASRTLSANANSIAGAQGVGMQIFQQVSAHYPVVQALRARLLGATTPKDVADAQAQIQAEQLWTANAESQLHAVAVMSEAQARSMEQQQNEKLDQDIDALIASAPGG